MHKNAKLLYKILKILYKETRADGLPQMSEGNLFFGLDWDIKAEALRKQRGSSVFANLRCRYCQYICPLTRTWESHFRSFGLILTFYRRFI